MLYNGKDGSYKLISPPWRRPPATVRAFNLILAPIFLNKKREVKVREESGGKIMRCDFYFNIIEVLTSNTVLMRCNLAILIFKR